MIKKLIGIISAFLCFTLNAQHFEPVWENPFNPMNVFIMEATLNNVDIAEGSEIGIFDTDPNTGEMICVGSKILTDEISPEDLFQVVCSMDDGTLSGMANGFTPGHTFQVKIYSPFYGEKGLCGINFPYPGYDENFTPLGTSFLEIYYNDPNGKSQTISLPSGWSGISANVLFINHSLNLIFENVLENLIMFSDYNDFFSGQYQGSTMNYWDNSQGYCIKLESPVTIELSGLNPTTNEIQIVTGWNCIPVLSESPVDITELFGVNFSEVILIKEVAGLNINWQEKQITTLTHFEPGKSYLIKANSSFIVTF